MTGVTVGIGCDRGASLETLQDAVATGDLETIRACAHTLRGSAGNFGATSVGTLSIRRFLRPVCYQNLPEGLLPEDVRAEIG